MTDMRRVSIAIPDALDQKILDLKKSEQFVRASYSEVARIALEKGLAVLGRAASAGAGDDQ